MSLNSKTIIITGGSRGIGAATAELAAERGANVVITARNTDKLADVKSRIEAAGGQVLTIAQQVQMAADWDKVFEETVSRFGAVHGLVNNAGVHAIRTMEDSTEEDYHWMMDTNVKGVFLGTKKAFEVMPRYASADQPAAIVNVSSTAGLRGASFQALYNMSKGAVQLFTKSSAQEAIDRRFPIRVNSVNPGMVDTDMGDELVNALVENGVGRDAEQARKNLTRGYMNRRFAKPEEVAKAICFLISDEASFTTGDFLAVDGGFINS